MSLKNYIALHGAEHFGMIALCSGFFALVRQFMRKEKVNIWHHILSWFFGSIISIFAGTIAFEMWGSLNISFAVSGLSAMVGMEIVLGFIKLSEAFKKTPEKFIPSKGDKK